MSPLDKVTVCMIVNVAEFEKRFGVTRPEPAMA
jgi:hypothetical protein